VWASVNGRALGSAVGAMTVFGEVGVGRRVARQADQAPLDRQAFVCAVTWRPSADGRQARLRRRAA